MRLTPEELIERLRESDFVSLHLPLTAETAHLLTARQLSWMKPTAYLINTARGPIVREEGLVEALRSLDEPGQLGRGRQPVGPGPAPLRLVADQDNGRVLLVVKA